MKDLRNEQKRCALERIKSALKANCEEQALGYIQQIYFAGYQQARDDLFTGNW